MPVPTSYFNPAGQLTQTLIADSFPPFGTVLMTKRLPSVATLYKKEMAGAAVASWSREIAKKIQSGRNKGLMKAKN